MPRIPRHRPMARYPAAKKPETSSPVRKRHGCGFSPTCPWGNGCNARPTRTNASHRPAAHRRGLFHHHVLTSPSPSRSRLRGWHMADGRREGDGDGDGAAQVPLHIRPMAVSTRFPPPSPLPPPDPYSFPDLISSSTASSSLHEVEVRLCLVALPASRPFTAAARRWGQKQDMQGFAGPSHCSCISFLFTDFVVWPQASHSSGPHRWSKKKVRNFAFETILNPAFAGPATLPPSDG